MPIHSLMIGCTIFLCGVQVAVKNCPPPPSPLSKKHTKPTGSRGSGHCSPPRSLYTMVSRKPDGERGERTTYSTWSRSKGGGVIHRCVWGVQSPSFGGIDYACTRDHAFGFCYVAYRLLLCSIVPFSLQTKKRVEQKNK